MMKAAWKSLRGVVHLRRDRARAQHLAERVDRPVMHHDPAVGILLAHLLELAAADLVRLDPRGSSAHLRPLAV